MSKELTVTPRQLAEELHQYIIAQSKVMGQSISEIGRSLKIMRDDKLYNELGHESFEDYTSHLQSDAFTTTPSGRTTAYACTSTVYRKATTGLSSIWVDHATQ